jgi:glycosyltransferase involved in cell wall biosynthesis
VAGFEFEAPGIFFNKMSALPKITVVTPSFNQGAYIERTIESVLSQGYPDLEYIIIDGGSTDNSVEVIRKFERHLKYWVSEKDRGQSHAINKGMLRANGSILTWLNSDDWYANRALLNFADLFIANPDAGVVVGRGKIVDQSGAVVYDKLPPSQIDFSVLCHWMSGGDFMQPSSAFSREDWLLVGPLREDIHIALDVDMWLRIAAAGCSFISTSSLLSTALSHPGAKTTAFVDAMRLDCARVIAAHGSMFGYEDALAAYTADCSSTTSDIECLEFKLAWFERNYRLLVSHPLVRLLQPIVKRFSRKGAHWQRDLPSWAEHGGR